MVRRVLVCVVALAGIGMVTGCGSTPAGRSKAEAASASGATTPVELALTNRGCSPGHVSVPAGKVAFHVSNRSGDTAEVEVLDGHKVLVEHENMAPGFVSDFTARLNPGTYSVLCGTDARPRGTLVVRGADGSTAAAPASPGPTGTVVHVQLSEFTVSLDRTSVAPGAVTFDVTSIGKIPHELVVMRTDLAPRSLPLHGRIVDEGDNAMHKVDEVEGMRAGDHERLTVQLGRGRYVLLCNMPDHYGRGMATALTVA